MLRVGAFYSLVAVAVPLAFFRPFEGLLIYMFFAHGHPTDFVWSGFVFNYGVVIGGSLIAGYLIFESRKSPLQIRGLVLLLLFWLWIAAGSFMALNPDLALGKLTSFNKIFIITLLVGALANSEERIGKVLRMIAICLGVLGTKSFIDIILTGGRFRIQGPGGMLSEENEFSLGMNMAVAILVFMASVEERWWLRRFFQVAAIGCGTTVVFTRSRSGLLGLITVCLLLTLYSRRKSLAIPGLALAVLAFVMFAPEAALDRYKTIPNAGQSDPSAIGRLEMWETALYIAKDHPFFGVGMRNFVPAVPLYTSYEPRAPHNALIALIAETGIPACLLFLGMVLGASRQSWVNWRRMSQHPDNRKLAAYCLLLHTTLLVYLVPNLFINRQDFDLMYHLVAVSAAMTVVVQRRLIEQRASQKSEILLDRNWTPVPEGMAAPA
ncbi:MAG TPA: putative O-glycosylation ligase, exosortase A system-associated [Candidatus Angelobacter sp.]|jgi:probable O-glycosylation ligase (exosortase A-associated)|nr:putative O-glycosylation ligase, exosortase A system-associated [Candidatus Angelobacter sp.]